MFLCTESAVSADLLKINGSTTVNTPVSEAAEILRARYGMAIHVDTLGGSSGGLTLLANGQAQIGMSSKPLTQADRDRHPALDIHVTPIGSDAIAMIVSPDVWRSGVRGLSAEQMRAIYEGRITRWEDVGGEDRRIALFNKEPGRGTWEVFAQWMYGDLDQVPLHNFPEVGGNEVARNKVGTTRGAISQLSASWADGKRIHALAVVLPDGRQIQPTPETVASGTYPIRRPLLLLTAGSPEGNVKQFVDFMLSKEGQVLVKKHGYLPLGTLRDQKPHGN
jgi:phosphate transport system substrate-binding protein